MSSHKISPSHCAKILNEKLRKQIVINPEARNEIINKVATKVSGNTIDIDLPNDYDPCVNNNGANTFFQRLTYKYRVAISCGELFRSIPIKGAELTQINLVTFTITCPLKIGATENDTTTPSILEAMPQRVAVPRGEFWERAYEPSVLRHICWLRNELLRDCSSDSRLLLRAIILGALHGPRTKSAASHLSNQCPRTFAPKPEYAVRFWRKRRMNPPAVDVVEVVRTRALRYLSERPKHTPAQVVLGDSRTMGVFGKRTFRWAITSPPYYGMRTYIPDQWLRNWFVGGPSSVTYRPPKREIDHGSSDGFADDLRKVWKGLATHAADDAKLVIRFGGIADRDVDPMDLLKDSLRGSGWRLTTAVSAGDANAGRRQATQFVHGGPAPREEHDFYAVLA